MSTSRRAQRGAPASPTSSTGATGATGATGSTGTIGSAAAPAASASGRPSARWAVAAAAVPLVVLVLSLLLGDGGPQPVPAGLPDPGLMVGWGLPVMQLAMYLCAVGTVGALLAGVVLAPGKDRSLSGLGYQAVRASSGWAAGWAVSALAVFVLQMSDILGPPPQQLLDVQVWTSYGLSVPQGRGALLVAGCTLVLAVAARRTLRASGGSALLLLALAAVLPPAFTGHSASAASHDIATSSLVVHVLAATVWAGGLLGLLLHLRRSGTALTTAVPRFSALALVCYTAVVGSGVINAWTRLTTAGDLLTTRYGLLVVGKTALSVALGWFGWRHRRSTMPAVRAHNSGAFARLAAGEVLVMGAAFGLAVALSRSPTPAAPERNLAGLSPAERLLGYQVPPVTLGRLLTDWRPDSIVLSLAVLALAGYLVGERRLAARQIAWPWWRTLSFATGVLVVVMCSGVATYAMAMFSVHMAQHMALTMLAPVLLAIGAPVTLALRALPAAGRDSPRGPREWLLAGLHSRPSRLVTQPVVALVIYLVSLYGLYFTPLFQDAMRSHSLHLLMSAHFLAVGVLFFFPIIGADPMSPSTSARRSVRRASRSCARDQDGSTATSTSSVGISPAAQAMPPPSCWSDSRSTPGRASAPYQAGASRSFPPRTMTPKKAWTGRLTASSRSRPTCGSRRGATLTAWNARLAALAARDAQA